MLLRKPRAYAEVYNDLDGEIVNLFRVLRDKGQAARLIELLRLTPFARTEFEASYEPTTEPVEMARRLIARSFMGRAPNSPTAASSSFRPNSNKSGRPPAGDWMNYPDALPLAIERLRGVIVERRPAVHIMDQHDTQATLHYIDPPYVHETRGRSDASREYRHEMDDKDHRELLGFVRGLKGMAVLSGYPHPLYDAILPDWRRIERPSLADGARKRTEVLWLNPACVAGLGDGPLFGEVAA